MGDIVLEVAVQEEACRAERHAAIERFEAVRHETESLTANLTAEAQRKAVNLMVERNASINEAPLRPVAHKRVEPLEQAFQDAISILSKNNSCSRFYGGINAAEARIEFDNVGALGERQVRNRAVRVQREHS